MRPSAAALVSAALAAAALVSAVPRAAAQPAATTTAEAEERRTRLFREGKAAADAGRWAEAAGRFRQVVAIRSAPKALIALGVAEEHLGHLVAALNVYKQAREEAADQALTDDLRTANAALESIRPRVPKVTLSPAEALAGATVEVDGEAARPEGGALLLDPGEHTLTATSAGKGTFRRTVTLREGELRDIPVVFSATAAPSATGTAGHPGGGAPDGGSARPPTGAIVVGATGIVLAGVGAALYGVGSGQYAESEKVCPGARCTPRVADSGNAGRTQMIAGDVLMVAGAAAIAGAGIYWIVAATSKKPQGTSLFIAPRAAGVEVGGRF